MNGPSAQGFLGLTGPLAPRVAVAADAAGCIEGLHRFAQGVVGALKNVGRQYDKTKQPPLRAMEKRPPFGGWRHHLPPASGGTTTRA